MHRAIVDREHHGIDLFQRHYFDARLHPRPLLGQYKLAPLKIDTGF
jgi:hypothetical protein